MYGTMSCHLGILQVAFRGRLHLIRYVTKFSALDWHNTCIPPPDDNTELLYSVVQRRLSLRALTTARGAHATDHLHLFNLEQGISHCQS